MLDVGMVIAMLAGGGAAAIVALESAGSTGLSGAALEQPESTPKATNTRSDFCMRLLYTETRNRSIRS
jgi:hypothetical protein